jgi:hypothetical protein
MARKILFDHVPKTGGSALHAVLRTWFGPDQVSPQLKGISMRDALGQYSKFDVISGHLRFDFGDILPTDRLCVSIIRDPVDRAVSSYFFARNHVANTAIPEVALAKTHDIESFFCLTDSIVRDGFSNVQVRHFASLGREHQSSSCALTDDALLKEALHVIRSFDLVGNFSDFEDFVALLGMQASVDRWIDVPKINVTSGRMHVNIIDPTVRRQIESMNELDSAFYAEIKHRFSQERSNTLKRAVGLPSGNNRVEVVRSNENKEHVESGAASAASFADFGSKEIEIRSILVAGNVSQSSDVLTGEDLVVSILLVAHECADDLTVGLHMSDRTGSRVFGTNSRLLGLVLSITSPGEMLVSFKMKCELGRGEYLVGASVHKGNSHLEKCFHWVESRAAFCVVGTIGAYFEGKVRLYPNISFTSNDNSSVLFSTSESSTGYSTSVMVHSSALTEFKIRIQPDTRIYRPMTGEVFVIDCEVTNMGSQTWPIAGVRPVSISYHWLHANRTLATFDGLRTRPSYAMLSEERQPLAVQVQAPYEPGDYVLQLTAVQENVAWFDERNCAPTEIPVTVVA